MKCEVCDKPATCLIRDVVQHVRPGEVYTENEPGELHVFCQAHRRAPVFRKKVHFETQEEETQAPNSEADRVGLDEPGRKTSGGDWYFEEDRY